MIKIGIITYHSAYNYGSVLQAYATQETLKNLGFGSVEMVDYRSASQKRAYAMYRTSYGPKVFFEDLSQLVMHGDRLIRRRRFEDFLATHMMLGKTLTNPAEAMKYCQKFDVMISGSDQIWNKHSLELETESWSAMDPYLLVGFTGRKVSYASSIGNMTDGELIRIADRIKQFDEISFREASGSRRVGRIVGRSPMTVLDPTLLLTSDDYNRLIDSRLASPTSPGYILVYCLAGAKYVCKLLGIVQQLSKCFCKEVLFLSPFFQLPYHHGNVKFLSSAGPLEFLTAIDNADIVITNSFHGTAFSIIYDKKFLSLSEGGQTDYRKNELLKRLGLIDAECCIDEISANRVADKSRSNDWRDRLSTLKAESMEYLESAVMGKPESS